MLIILVSFASAEISLQAKENKNLFNTNKL